jgi:hypothetical protein
LYALERAYNLNFSFYKIITITMVQHPTPTVFLGSWHVLDTDVGACGG